MCSASSAALVIDLRLPFEEPPPPLLLPLRDGSLPAHWMRRMRGLTVGMMLRRLSVAKVRVCSSGMLVGGGVPGSGTSKDDVEEWLRPWCDGLMYVDVFCSNAKPRSSRACVTWPRQRSGTRM